MAGIAAADTGPEMVTLDYDFALDILEVLRLTPIYALLNSEQEDQLGDDFKPHKWEGFELEHAHRATAAFRALVATMTDQAADHNTSSDADADGQGVPDR
jgi:hypothetical protein